MIKITEKLFTEIAAKAGKAERKRSNYNFHEDNSDPINRMINVMERSAYFPPHKHEDPDKREVFIILKGRVVMVEYDDSGNITDHIILDPREGSFGVELGPRTWHNLIPLDEVSVLYEIKDGPYDKEVDKTFAGWAPREGEEGAKGFVKSILGQLGLNSKF
jgi:cupin fold WbuC family metalloprotein